ncbi:type II toxin-antitoxin system HicA family toxin [Pseudomonas aeruginosa]|nr:type II toxin-antitoxin system HicA family toxin [Pseudomonas aeruginosa]
MAAAAAARKACSHCFQYALANGWRVGLTNGGHLRFTKAERPVIHTSSTPSDWRAVRNAVAMLARADRKEVILV